MLRYSPYFVLTICLLFSCVATSDEPIPGERIGSQAPEQETEKKQTEPKPTNEIWNPPASDLITIPEEQDSSGQPNKEKKDGSPSQWIILFTGVLAVVAVLQLIVLYKQGGWLNRSVKAAEQSANVAADTAKRQLRAYLSIESGEVTLVNNGQACRTRVCIKNTGQTPAYNVSTSMSYELRALPQLAPTFNGLLPKEERSSSSIVGPGVIINIHGEFSLTTEQLESIRNGSSGIFVWGEADYVDAYKISQYYRFRMTNGEEDPGGTWPLKPMDSGNEAT